MSADQSRLDSGIALARAFYHDVVADLLARMRPGMPYAAARLGSGSDVLGLDDDVSRDHDWGLRLALLVPAPEVAAVDALLAEHLPESYAGHPVRFATTWQPTQRHQVEVATAAAFATSRLGVDASRPLTPGEWLCLTGQSVLEVTAGEVFVDTAGELTEIRRRLQWYPDDVWLHVLAADWDALSEELPFIGRTALRGDELGSRVLTARLVGIAMHLGFLLERTWPPYPKWFGTQFARLPRAGTIIPELRDALTHNDFPARQQALIAVLNALLALQRERGLPAPSTAVQPFYTRTDIVGTTDVAGQLRAAIRDPEIHALPPGGSVEQWVDCVPRLMDPDWRLSRVDDAGAHAPEEERDNQAQAST